MRPFENQDDAQPVGKAEEGPGHEAEPDETPALAATSDTASNLATPVDLNQPIENPRLVEAIKRHAQYNSVETSNELFARLNEATYLAVFFDDEVTMTPGEHEGETIFEPGSVLKMPTCTDSNDQVFLPLFTDWDEIRAWIDDPVSTLILPAAEAWAFVLHDQYDGAVINPAGQLLPLEPRHLQALLADDETAN